MYKESNIEKYDSFVSSKENRFSSLENEKNSYTTFRTILYKK